MNKTTIRFLTGTFLLLFLAGLTPLMGQSEEQIEKFKKEREIYFTEKIELFIRWCEHLVHERLDAYFFLSHYYLI